MAAWTGFDLTTHGFSHITNPAHNRLAYSDVSVKFNHTFDRFELLCLLWPEIDVNAWHGVEGLIIISHNNNRQNRQTLKLTKYTVGDNLAMKTM